MKIRRKMTPRAIAARQISAQLSTGPKTILGKKRASSNALKEGLYSKELNVSEADKPEFELLRKSIFQQLAPGTPLQTIAADTVVACSWRCKLAMRLETRTLANFSTAPEESQSEKSDSERDAGATQWYGASRSALRAGMRLLADLHADIAQDGALHLAARKDEVVKAFGMEFYDNLETWKPMNMQAILAAEAIAAHQKNFNIEPIPALQPAPGVKVVVDERQKVDMMLKLIELQMQHLADLSRSSSLAQTSGTVLTDFIPRHFPTVSRDLQRAVDWFLYLKENKL